MSDRFTVIFEDVGEGWGNLMYWVHAGSVKDAEGAARKLLVSETGNKDVKVYAIFAGHLDNLYKKGGD